MVAYGGMIIGYLQIASKGQLTKGRHAVYQSVFQLNAYYKWYSVEIQIPHIQILFMLHS